MVASAGSQPAFVARIVHNTPGRLRLRLPRPALADSAQPLPETLAVVPGVQQVRLGLAASSLLVLYDPASVGVAALTEALHQAGVHVTAEAEIEPAPLAGDGPSAASQAINRVAAQFDARVGRATGNVFDLRTLIPLGIGALAVREILLGRLHAAPWYTLVWWTFDSYLKLRRPAQAALASPPPGPVDQ